MTKAQIRSVALALPEAERLALAEELWASVEDANTLRDASDLPQWQADLIDRRLEETRDDPGQPWTVVRAEIWPTDS